MLETGSWCLNICYRDQGHGAQQHYELFYNELDIRVLEKALQVSALCCGIKSTRKKKVPDQIGR